MMDIWPDIQKEFELEYFEADRDFYNSVATHIYRQFLTDEECSAVFYIKQRAISDRQINGQTLPKSHWPLIEQVTWLLAQGQEVPDFIKEQAL